MVQVEATAAARPSDHRRPPFGLIAVVITVVVLAALVFTLQPQIVDPSADGCLIVIVGAPLLALAYFLDRVVHRRQAAEIRDARRGGISIGTSRLQRELVSLADLSTVGLTSTVGVTSAVSDPGRFLDALNQEV
jgi:hypothetical protein